MPIPEQHIYVKTVELSGTDVKVYVAPYSGRFYTYDPSDSELNTGYNMEEVIHGSRGPLRRRKITVEIPFRQVSSGTIRDGIAMSIHSGTGNVTVKFPGERKQQFDSYEARKGIYRGDTTDETIDKIRRAEASLQRAQTVLHNLQHEWMIELDDVVAEAIAAKLAADDEQAWKIGAAAALVANTDDEASDEEEEF